MGFIMAQLTCNFFSYTLRRAIDISVIIPTPVFSDALDPDKKPSHTPADRYPVLYLLHGYGNDYSTWLRYTSAERYAEESNIALVTISGENKYYSNLPNQDLFYDFIETELPEFVCGLFPISRQAENTYIAGLSMGGYGALLHALQNPSRFGAFGAFSPGLPSTGLLDKPNFISDGDRIDLSAVIRNMGNAVKNLPPCYMSCGTEDFLFEVNAAFKDLYLSLGGRMEWKAVPGYGHEWAFWDAELRCLLDWLPRADPFRDKKRRV